MPSIIQAFVVIYVFVSKYIIISRTKDFISYEYLNEKGIFSSNIYSLLILKDHFEAESKIVKKGNFYYIAYTKDSISSEIFLIRTDSLLKPFTKEIKI